MQPDVVDVIVRALAVELETSEEAVRGARSLRTDLGMDSIAAANVLFNLEEELGVELALEEVERLDTLAAILAVVDRFLPAAEG